MSIFTTALEAVSPYSLWIKLGAMALAVFFVFGTGYKVGEWKQGNADSQEVQDAKDALIKNSLDVAAAEKQARDDTAKEYESQIKDLNFRNEQTAEALAGYQAINRDLSAKNVTFQHTIEGLRHDKANANFLDTPIPASIRDQLLHDIH